MKMLQPIIERAVAAGGSRRAVEAFLRFAAGDANFERMEPLMRERLLGIGDTLFRLEFGVFERYRPEDEALSAVTAPVPVMPGAHTPHRDHPREMVDAIRPFLRHVSAG